MNLFKYSWIWDLVMPAARKIICIRLLSYRYERHNSVFLDSCKARGSKGSMNAGLCGCVSLFS